MYLMQKSGSDAAIVRIHNKDKAIAVSVDCLLIMGNLSNYWGQTNSLWKLRNLITVGAKPLAITNCLNFGNPENKEIMGEFAECLRY